ncbi:pyridoxamine 5'-phosphate oxidase family protein [Solirubrobacter ginsenosidimutans]|uniref:Pyridoxamine 5'-phosphate oxidase family protein n=1 Tax=Solirubrobacter ginsenosidimutans TaxID=490573 RepID=A0A9X3N3H8_9ACTN|nr:pyridoxamine 5'-phosphate oxidase family protein [Solirubrobacter ginsenosidimutans]MDA0166586.1 pyridoxamine 5'-phosphate oxidase family protein [Solirubrobacter ginsenosidimutans]
MHDLPDWAAVLLEEMKVAHLGLLDDAGHPRVQPITFARVEDLIVSAVDDKPKRRPGELPVRLRRLRRHPRVALTVDRYDDDWTHLAWVQLLGDVTIAPIDAPALEALQRRYPVYLERPPNGPLLKLRPERVLSWRSAG